MISVSDLGRHVFCERITYLKKVLGCEPELDDAKKTELALRQLHCHLSVKQHEILSRSSSRSDFSDRLHAEARLFFVDDYFPGVAPIVDSLADDVWFLVGEIGFEEALNYLKPSETSLFVSSTVLCLYGVLDKVYFDGFPVPCDVRTGVSNNIWETDKVELCCYGLLLEERKGIGVKYGFLEYGIDKIPVVFSERLRCTTLGFLEECMKIASGRIPDICPHGNPRKCMVRDFQTCCYTV